MDNIIQLPRHLPPVLHKKAALMSFENCFKLGKIYKEVIGVGDFHHFSLNVVDENGEMSILSYNPQIAFNIFKDGSYLYNGSISPTFYENKEMYTWDETYDPRYYHSLLNNMERKNGIKKGVVLTEKKEGKTLLFSFATKGNAESFIEDISNNKSFYLSIGQHCYSLIKPILDIYVGSTYDNNEKTRNTAQIIKLQNK